MKPKQGGVSIIEEGCLRDEAALVDHHDYVVAAQPENVVGGELHLLAGVRREGRVAVGTERSLVL